MHPASHLSYSLALSLTLGLSGFISGCKPYNVSSLSKTASQAVKPSVDPQGAELLSSDTSPLVYAYNIDQRKCVDAAGVPGFNVNRMAECGQIEKKVIEGGNYAGKNLRGLRVHDSFLNDSDFSGADLEGASISKSEVSGSNFSGANLKSFSLTVHESNRKGLRFKNARINASTRIHFSLTEASEEGMIFESRTQKTPSRLAHWVYSDEVSTQEKGLLFSDFDLVGKLQLSNQDPKALPKGLKEILGGTDSAALLGFISKRVKFVKSDTTLRSSSGLIRGAYNSTAHYWINELFRITDLRFNLVSDLSNFITGKIDRSALNLNPKSNRVDEINLLEIQGKRVSISDFTGSGVVTLDVGFRDLNSGPIGRVALLLHEARHSDCAAESDEETLRLKKTRDELLHALTTQTAAARKMIVELQASPEAKLSVDKWNLLIDEINKSAELYKAVSAAVAANSCGYSHVDCSKEHPEELLRGATKACDDIAWGAYTVGGIASMHLAKNCTNCTEEERQLALIEAQSSLSRVEKLEEMLEGKRGAPKKEHL